MIQQNIAGQDVSRETIERLELFAALATKWTRKINLVSASTVGDIWDRHIVDSAQIFQFAPSSFNNWVDIGSGGGFPGIVVAAMSKDINPEAGFTLIESDQRKCAFLRTAARELEIEVTVLAQRIDVALPQNADVMSARALSSLTELMPHFQRHLRPEGVALLHKGRKWSDEVQQSRKEWVFEIEDYPSMTDDEARIIKLNRIDSV